MLSVVILAGGQGTRLGTLTKKTPKPLIRVAGKPFLFHQLNYLYKQGIRKVVLCLGYLHNMIEKKIGNGSSFGLNITYSYDGNFFLGTGGAIKKALPLLEDNFYILYGDSFLPIQFEPIQKYYFMSNRPALMTVIFNENKWDKSNVICKDGLVIEYNKKETKEDMKFIDYGLSILSKSLFKNINEDFFDLSNLYQKLSIEGKLLSYEVRQRFYEIGSKKGLKETDIYLSTLEK
jgi:NDP-sugar pyrophosphorylase family protein